MQTAAKTDPGAGAAVSGAKKASLEKRALDELKHYAVVTLYLWVLFLLFATYKRMLLHENGISGWNQSFAIVNALIFGKVILIFQAINLGRRLKGLALAWIVLGRSLMFTIGLILFHVAEEALRAWFKELPLATSIQDFGGGTLLGFATYAAILFVALIPFFAISEMAEIIGADALWKLMFTSGQKAFKLVQE